MVDVADLDVAETDRVLRRVERALARRISRALFIAVRSGRRIGVVVRVIDAGDAAVVRDFSRTLLQILSVTRGRFARSQSSARCSSAAAAAVVGQVRRDGEPTQWAPLPRVVPPRSGPGRLDEALSTNFSFFAESSTKSMPCRSAKALLSADLALGLEVGLVPTNISTRSGFAAFCLASCRPPSEMVEGLRRHQQAGSSPCPGNSSA